MKKKAKELDVDFIGGQDKPLTEDEQLVISAFLKQLKKNNNKDKTKQKLVKQPA